jgi:hypothetical protein
MRISNSLVLIILSAVIIIVSMFPFTFDVGFAFGVDDKNDVYSVNRSLITDVGKSANVSGVLINEVQYNPIQPGVDSLYEWFELYNACNETVELAGWNISDNNKTSLIPSLNISPYGFAVIAASENYSINYPDYSGIIVFLGGRIGNGLGNDGDHLVLTDGNGSVIGGLSYGSDKSGILPLCPAVADGHSIERFPAGGDLFIDNSAPTPGYGLSDPTSTPTPVLTPSPTTTPAPVVTPTPSLTATPIASPSPEPTPMPTVVPSPSPVASPTSPSISTGTVANRSDLLVNEVMYDPKATPEADHEWIELYNTCNETIELAGWKISDNASMDDIPTVTVLPHRFVVIAAKANFFDDYPNFNGSVVFINGSIGSGLNNDGDRITLNDSAGTVIDELSYGKDESITSLPDVDEGCSLERQPAGGEFIDNSVPTPGSGLPMPTPVPTPTLSPTPTAVPSSTPVVSPTPTPAGTVANRGDILINEVQYNPPQSGADAAYEWVEIYNTRNETVELIGWEIRDNGGYDLTPFLNISPYGFVIIAASENFSVNFPNYTGKIVFLEDGDIGNGLGNNGDRLRMQDSLGTVIDEFSYGDDESITLPPHKKVAEGHSMERRPAGGEFIDNAEPTPGRGLSPLTPTPNPTSTPTPSVSPTPTNMPQGTVANRSAILINEVQSNPLQSGSDSSYEWIELFNPGTEVVELIGWGMSDNYEMDEIPLLSVSANGLVVVAASENFSVNFPSYNGTIVFTADGRIGNGLGNAGDRLILKDSAGTIIDEMSYGDDDSITSQQYPNVADGHSLERAPCGGQFIDNEVPTPGRCLPSYNQTPVLTPTPTPVFALTQILPESNSSDSININRLHLAELSRHVSSMAHTSSSIDQPVESPGMPLKSLLITLSSSLIVILGWTLYRRKAR